MARVGCAQGIAYVHSLVKMMLVYVVESTALRSAEDAATAKPGSMFCAADVLPLANAPLNYLALAPPSVWTGPRAIALPRPPVPADASAWVPQPLPPTLPNASWAHQSDEAGLAALATPGKVGGARTPPLPLGVALRWIGCLLRLRWPQAAHASPSALAASAHSCY